MASQIPMEQQRNPAGKDWPLLPACEQLSSHVLADTGQIITSVYGLEMYSEPGIEIPVNYQTALESYGLCKIGGVTIPPDQLFQMSAPDSEKMGTANEQTKPVEKPSLPPEFLEEQQTTTVALAPTDSHGPVFYGILTMATITTLITVYLILEKTHGIHKIKSFIQKLTA